MAELLLELFSEEIPARMQARAAEELKRLVTEKLKAAGLAFAKAESYVTPRRLALGVHDLPTQQPDISEEKKGPRVGSPDQAVQGFLKSAGLASLDQCEQRDTGKGIFWFAVSKKTGGPTAAMLPALLSEAVAALSWPKSMRFASQSFRWVRPLHAITAMFDGKPLKGRFDLGGAVLNFGDESRGHRFLSPGAFPVDAMADYKHRLKEHYVILDPSERRAEILRQAEAKAGEVQLKLRHDEGLLDEVTGLVEWPVVLMGRIDEAFMSLPPEVLTGSMRAHQKYFAVTEGSGKLAPRFLVVSNMETKDKGAAIVAGNERVLRARLSDAQFFWDQDRKVRLEERLPALKDIVFHAKLGTVAEKMARVKTLALELAKSIPGADPAKVARAAELAKADLVTGMVGEFPELQGVMGRYYALAQGEAPEVAHAIAEHYSPLGPNDACPTAPVSVAVALADKIDILVGFFAIDEKPTGSKDPFALRRAALGAIRLIIENKLRISLRAAFKKANSQLDYQQAGSTGKFDSEELLTFFADRLKVALKEKGARHDLIAAVFALGGDDDLVRLLARVEALAKFLATEDGAHLLTAQKRAANILRIEEKKDGKSYEGGADPELFKEAAEKALGQALGAAADRAQQAVAKEDFTGAMAAMSSLRSPVDAFFDTVTVNDANPDLRANRLRLLSRIRATLGLVADFSKIEG
ncbi:glycine--tRNA ligase beta subunit [Hypericibacter terrae]|uniref:Glycine--tRNA ligase beta subunit n=1 Tax=Hypericibacter terrae TaxID=2602015 RepID=A0A5J6MEX5_9PROT|nr:glycine--tRNA ligase subunit beta [Hypericibacter terrae]QEX16028.1 glycine--tRNA ligase beta subunit [Hypericibacter terrae]